MNKLNFEIVKYVEENIFPMYSKNERGHGIEHIKTVIRKSLELADGRDVDMDMVYVIAVYHDLGHHIDRKRHEIVSAKLFMEDENMKKWFTDDKRNIIKEAIEDHRASSNHKPRSIYGMIVSSADRTIVSVDNSIKRAYSYGLRNFPEYSEEEQIERIYNHLYEKYYEGGYAKTYLKNDEYEEGLKKLRIALEDKEKFIERIKEVIKD